MKATGIQEKVCIKSGPFPVNDNIAGCPVDAGGRQADRQTDSPSSQQHDHKGKFNLGNALCCWAVESWRLGGSNALCATRNLGPGAC